MSRDLEHARDQRLVAAGIDGDSDALGELVDHYYRPVFGLAFRMLNDEAASADIAQATFLAVFENLSGYDPRYKFFSWVYRIAMNKVLDHRSKRRLVPLEDTGEVESDCDDPVTETVLKETSMMVRETLSRLSDDYAAVLTLRHYGEFRYDEIAEILDIPEKTVRSRLYSARQKLKSELEGSGFRY